MAKYKLEELRVGQVAEATFFDNDNRDRFLVRATHLDGKRTPKVVLSNDAKIEVGKPCAVRIEKIEKGPRDDRGYIEVSFVKALDFELRGVYLDPWVSKKLQVLLESGLNILLDGPQGCGKTVLVRAITETLGLRYVFFNCSAVVEATDFVASLQVRASEKGSPVTDFVPTEILLALEEANQNPKERFLVFLDEFNRCQESARNALMPALDATRRIFNPIENRFLDIPENVQFVAAVNRGREFSATFGIDAAQLDRFAPLQMNYPPPEAEVELLMSKSPELSKKLLIKIVDIATQLRQSPELDSGLSVRATDEACVYLKHPLIDSGATETLKEILKSSFCGRFSGRFSDPTSDAGAAWAIIEHNLRKSFEDN